MPVNFPNNPSNSDTYKVNNVTYTYVTASNKWKPGTVSTPSTGLDSAAVNSLISATPSSGTTTYDSIGALPLSGNSAGDIAFIDSADRLFVYNGAGWYSISLVNATPTISSVVDSDGGTTPFILSTEGATTVITITASDPDGVPPTLTYGYSVTSGSLTNGGGTTATVVQDSSDTNVFRVTPTTTEAYAGDFTLTFTASDGINTGTSANQFSLAFSVGNSNYTTFLLQADTSGNDNQVDASSNSFTITEAGNVTSTAFGPYHPKGYSTYFDGSGDYLDLDFNAIGTNDFTFECWVYVTDSAANQLVFDTRPTSTDNTTGFNLQYRSNNVFSVGSFSVTYITGSTTLTDNTWYHVAVTRSGSTMTLWVNGESDGTASHSVNLTSTDMRIGTNRSAASVYNGYISDFRLVSGTAVYTSAFTPPTEPLTAISGTQLLTCTNKNDIWDAASGGRLVTRAGNTTASTTRTKYSSSSIYLDGSGDYAKISIPEMEQLAIGTRDFTIEFWFNSTGTNSNNLAFFTFADSYAGGSGFHFELNSGTLKIWSGNGPSFGTCPTFSANTWHHIAVVSEGGDLHCYFDGTEVGTGILGKNFTGTVSYPEIWLGAYSNSGYGTPYSSISTATYFEDLRVTLDVARYTANFTPPTAALKG